MRRPKMRIGIIGAMDIEVEELINSMDDIKKETISRIDFYEGRLQDKDVVVAKCGVGKVHAAVCTQTMILKFAPDIIINTGVAGSLSPDLNIADIVISDGVVQHDFDISPFGKPVGLITGIDLIKIPCNEELVKQLVKAAEILEDTNIAVGPCAFCYYLMFSIFGHISGILFNQSLKGFLPLFAFCNSCFSKCNSTSKI
jgi:adenosylhomocysteine nucleosidase